MYKKVLSIFLTLILGLFLAGCTIPGTDINVPIPYLDDLLNGTDISVPVNKEVTITYWSLFEPFELYQPLILQYEQENPGVKIVFEQKVFDDLDVYKDTLLSKLQLKETTPDIVRIHSSWVPKFSDSLSPAPEDVVSAASVQSDYYSTVTETSVLNGRVYSLPLMFDSLALFYNKDAFDSGSLSPPATWSEFADLSISLTQGSGSNITRAGAAFGSADNVAHFSDILGLMMNQSDVELPRDMNSDAMKEIIVFYTNFVTQMKVWDTSQVYSPLSFSQGRTAMMFGPSWQLLNILENNPNLNVGVAPVPQVVSENSLTDDNFASYWVEAVNVNSENSKEAWKFIKWLSQPEQLRSTFNQAANTRAFGEPYPRVSMQSELASNVFLAPFYVNADRAKARKFADLSGNSNYVEILKNVVEGVINGGDVGTLLQTAEQEYNRLDSL